jgi:hypothetical protein
MYEAKQNRYFFGTRKSDKARIYLSAPSWNCDWYWSFGYLGNSNEHYHLSSYANGRNINLYDALVKDYDLNLCLADHNLWLFCELARTAYSLKESAEVFGRGGSHYCQNPCAELIKDEGLVAKINGILLPAIFEKIEQIFISGQEVASPVQQ